jgi:hypothetical protein
METLGHSVTSTAAGSRARRRSRGRERIAIRSSSPSAGLSIASLVRATGESPNSEQKAFRSAQAAFPLGYGRVRFDVYYHEFIGFRVQKTLRDEVPLFLDGLVGLDGGFIGNARTLKHLRVGSAVQVHGLQLRAPELPGPAGAPLQV